MKLKRINVNTYLEAPVRVGKMHRFLTRTNLLPLSFLVAKSSVQNSLVAASNFQLALTVALAVSQTSPAAGHISYC